MCVCVHVCACVCVCVCVCVCAPGIRTIVKHELISSLLHKCYVGISTAAAANINISSVFNLQFLTSFEKRHHNSP